MSAPPELLARQRGFKARIDGRQAAEDAWHIGLGIYTEAYGLRLGDELAKRYPRCAQALGARFAELVAAYRRAMPSRSPLMQLYGQGFGTFVQSALPAEPWLAALAALEWARFEALHGDEAPADSYAPLSQGQGRLVLNPTLRLQLSPWRLAAPFAPEAVCQLVWKHGGRLYEDTRPMAAHALLSALLSGAELETACARDGLSPEALSDWFSAWGSQGLILGFEPLPSRRRT